MLQCMRIFLHAKIVQYQISTSEGLWIWNRTPCHLSLDDISAVGGGRYTVQVDVSEAHTESSRSEISVSGMGPTVITTP